MSRLVDELRAAVLDKAAGGKPVPLDTPAGTLETRLAVLLAKFEKQRMGERIKVALRARKERLAAGRPTG